MGRRKLSEADYEAIREALDACMIGDPQTAHIVREQPLSKKYQDSLVHVVERPMEAKGLKKSRRGKR